LGRVNRLGKKPIEVPNIWIMQPDPVSYLIYDKARINKTLELLMGQQSKILNEKNLVNLINVLYQDLPWTERDWEDFNRAYQHEGITKYTEKLLPGSYKPWLTHVIENRDSFDVLLPEDEMKFQEMCRFYALEAAGLQIPVRVNPKTELKWNLKKNLPPLLKKPHTYSRDEGLRYL